MSKPHIKRMFPGAVTSQGFFSYYNYMISSDAEHIYVIKGGPGVGKSTFMKRIGTTMLEHGYDIEYHCCSSDNNSIDGIVIPELNVALLDGTAPHIVDPKNPGAVDEIINLGEYWDEDLLYQAKDSIIQSNYKVSRYFQAAYFALQEAKVALNEWEFYVNESQDWGKINQMYLGLEKSLFNVKSLPSNNPAKQRHLFAWAHTPQGKSQFIDSLLQGITCLYELKGQPGTGKSTFLKKLADRALTLGLSVEFYHNTLDPQELDLILLPDLQVALVINSEPYAFTSEFKGSVIPLDFDASLDLANLTQYQTQIDSCRKRINASIERALENSKAAKAVHDAMENYYIPAMDFTEIEKKRLSILEQILNLADHRDIAVGSKGGQKV